MPPTISAVIATRRRPTLVRRAVESVLAQTWEDLEVVVCDNASGDGTREVLDALAERDPRVKVHVHECDIGALANFQFGLDHASGQYVSILSDDDVLLPGFYAHAIACLQRESEARFFCGRTALFNPLGGTWALWPSRLWSEGLHPQGRDTLLMYDHLFLWTGCLFSREVCSAAGPLAEGTNADDVFLPRAAARFPFVVSLAPCAVINDGGDRAYLNMTPEALLDAKRRALQILAEDPAVLEVHRAAFRSRRVPLDAMLYLRARRAFVDGNWERLDAIAAWYKRQGGAEHWGTCVWLRLATARVTCPRLIRGLHWMAHQSRRWRARLKRAPRADSIEAVVDVCAPALIGIEGNGCQNHFAEGGR